MHEDERDDPIDELLREAAPRADAGVARRAVTRATSRLARRRRLLRTLRWTATAAAAAIVLAAITLVDLFDSPPHPAPVQVTTTPVVPDTDSDTDSDTVADSGADADTDTDAVADAAPDAQSVPFPRHRPDRPPSTKALVRNALENADPAARASAVVALGRRSPAAAAGLIALGAAELDRADLDVFVSESVQGLDRHSLAALRVEVLAHARSDSGRRLLGALGRSGAPAAWPLLEAALEDGPDVAAIAAAGELGDPRAVPRLARWLHLVGPAGEATAAAIGRIPGPEAVGALLGAFRALPAPLARVEPLASRRELLADLVRARGEESIGVLDDGLRRGRDAAASVGLLVELFPDAAPAALAGALAEVDRPAQSAILRGLADLGTPTAVAALLAALEDPRLAREARQHLVRVAHRDLGPRPRAWRRWFEEGRERSSIHRPRGELICMETNPKEDPWTRW